MCNLQYGLLTRLVRGIFIQVVELGEHVITNTVQSYFLTKEIFKVSEAFALSPAKKYTFFQNSRHLDIFLFKSLNKLKN